MNCGTCGRFCCNQHALDQHQPHCLAKQQPRTLPCPGCGQLYRQIADAAQHFESGYCRGCPGLANARQVAHSYVRSQNGGANFLTNGGQQQLIGYHDNNNNGSNWQPPPTANYTCPGCRREFNALGSLMQHQAARQQCRAGGGPPNHLAITQGGGLVPPRSRSRSPRHRNIPQKRQSERSESRSRDRHRRRSRSSSRSSATSRSSSG